MGVEDKHILGKVPEKINLVTKFFSFFTSRKHIKCMETYSTRQYTLLNLELFS
jgi:hypothetical protein